MRFVVCQSQSAVLVLDFQQDFRSSPLVRPGIWVPFSGSRFASFPPLKEVVLAIFAVKVLDLVAAVGVKFEE